ncbi:CPBP family intramembrane glutamic endopeptidase [Sphingomonas immobilis]|uniref:CPBP family intramembrane metalloprotease n=1 Tax=Sphingomonas immobilis TaxID=3063997 RepID=A0ABT9A2N8_9SPHN|nr:CPBP family intramembrane glutamic endopeptidase [Sphingomonas sp. CA1-15]MDO7843813.1 CPBP family intramembrane metalloprotease [Sphingomonas sp. CA1-15]
MNATAAAVPPVTADKAAATTGVAKHVRAGVALIAGLAIASGVILYGPTAIEPVLVKLDSAATPAIVETVFTAAIYGALLIVGVIGGALCGVNALKPGRRPLAMLGLGLFVGLFGVTVTAGYAGIVGSLKLGPPHANSAAMLAWGAALILLQSAAEEVYFRGWLQRTFAKAWGPPVAIFVAALAFSVLHSLGEERAIITFANLFLGGLLFGILAAYGRGILGAVAAHFAWNGAEQMILGLDPNPGVGTFGSLFNFELFGPKSWGGSTEGLNASIAMTLTLVALVVPLVLLVRNRLERAE